MEQLKNRLEAKDIKPTYIRLKILNYIEGNKMHPTASMIYKELITEMPTISKMSIYNTLNSFLEKGIALPIIITGQEVRFDGDMSSHHHFLCEKCGKIIDMDIECKYCEYFKKGQIHKHKINEVHVYLKGICKDCLKKEGNK